MRLLRNQIALDFPDAVVLLSTANEGQTESDIMEMGERLANEFKNYILSYCPEQCISKISLIGHSLGGLIIRAALPHLAEYSSKFHLFCSMGSPHLGYL
jgi:triacylglycerol esterase/lipase EstA (alpha/beta hydrolase family)